MNEQTLADVVDRLSHRFYGKYRGTVTEIDSSQVGRIKAKVPAVLGDQATGWCMPCVPYAGPDAGFLFLPDAGSGVWIEFEGGDVSYPIWTGGFWRSGEAPSEAGARVKVIKTKGGHKIVMDDEQQTLLIADANRNTITLDSSGITLTRGAMKIQITDLSVTINDSAFEVM